MYGGKTPSKSGGERICILFNASWHLVQNILILKNRRDKKIFFTVYAFESELPGEK